MDKKEKWKVEDQKVVYSDPWLRVRVDTVIRPNTGKGTYSVAALKGGIGVVVLTEDKKIVLVGQYRYTVDRYSWEIPKGAFDTFDSAESPLSRAKIELDEETGINAKNWEQLTMVHTLLGSSNDRVFLFLATDITWDKPHPEKTENIEIKLATFEEFYEMVKKEDITDATSIAAVSLAERQIQKTK